MAGPPQEPSWTPAGQEQTQARPGWPQQPSFTPPPPPQQDAYGYPPPQQQPAGGGYPPPPPPQPGYGGQEQAYAQEQPYAGQDQTYAGQDQAYAGQGQQYQAQAQPDPGPAQWQGVPGVTPGRPGGSRQKALGERGFFGSLFDFSFTSMVTPKIIKVLYVLFAIWTGLLALIIAVISFRTGGLGGGLVVLILIEPFFVLLMLGVSRVILEAFMVVFRIYEETVKLREQGDRQL